MLPFDASVGVHGTGSENSLRGTGVAVLVRWLGSRAGMAYESAGRLHSPAPGRALRGSQASVARRTAVGLAQVPIEVAKPPSGRVLSGTGESLTSQAAPQGAHEHALRHAWLSADTHAPSSKFAQKWLCLFLRYSGPPSFPVQSSREGEGEGGTCLTPEGGLHLYFHRPEAASCPRAAYIARRRLTSEGGDRATPTGTPHPSPWFRKPKRGRAE